MDESDRCEVSYPMRTWASKFQLSKRKTTDFLKVFSDISLIFLEYDNSTSVGKIKIKIPNLLKYRDEYSKKLRTNSGATPDKLRSKIEIEKQIKNRKPPSNPPKGDVELPDWLPVKEWDAYLQMRKSVLRKPLMPDNFHLAFKKLDRLKAQGYLPALVLNQSVFNSWQGLFEVKDITVESAPQEIRKDLPGYCKVCGGGKKSVAAGFECKKCGNKTKTREE